MMAAPSATDLDGNPFEVVGDTLDGVRRRRLRRRTRAADLLMVLFWVSIAMAVLLFITWDGLARMTDVGSTLSAAGIVAGLVGTDLVLVMLVLAARIPLIDRIIGHDTAMSRHRRLGKPALYLIVAHGILLTFGYAAADNFTVVDETIKLLQNGDNFLAYVALGLFVVIVISSLVAVVRRFSYEAWYVIHLLSYLAIILALPHQSVPNAVLADGSAQYAYWLTLYAIAFGSLLVFRCIVPLVRSVAHGIRVQEVEEIGSGVFSIHLTGRRLDRLRTSGGQYAIWRFWAGATWWHAHPISFSALPTATSARITVRNLGRGSAALGRVRPGTRVSMSGPLGIFTDATRTSPRLAVIAAGIGITPVRSLLEDSALRPGEATVLLRGTDETQTYLWDEVGLLTNLSGTAVTTMLGARPKGLVTWMSADAVSGGTTIATVFPDLLGSDLYVCGPPTWTDLVVRDARTAGLPEEQIHVERFDW